VSRCGAVARRKRNFFRKIRTQRSCGTWKELAAAGRKMICCAEVARRKGHKRKGQKKNDDVARSQ
jgi:hypothetical protein